MSLIKIMLPSCSSSKAHFGLSMATTPTQSSSAAAVSFFLDREGHKKFLRAATNQELEVENRKLKEELTSKTEECGRWYDSYQRDIAFNDKMLRELRTENQKAEGGQ